jgi:hypothetical protein
MYVHWNGLGSRVFGPAAKSEDMLAWTECVNWYWGQRGWCEAAWKRNSAANDRRWQQSDCVLER